jgi:uncharacterized membrane protein
MINVTFYSKKDSSACDEVRENLKSLQEQYPHRLAEVDVDTDPILTERLGASVPVVEVGPYTLKSPISIQSLQMTLGAASDRKNQLEQVGDKVYQMRVEKGKNVSTGDRVSFWISKRYLLLLNLFMFLYVGLPFLAPTLMEAGATGPANLIYKMYKPFCHQFAFRSFFLFGEQAYYPLKEANVQGVKTLEDVTGITDLNNPYSMSRFQAREYTGNATVGYKVALCERDVAIYLAILLFGLFYGATGRKIKGLHWAFWLLLGIAPIGLDGFSQLFSQFNWAWLASVLPYRESTPFFRVLTGALFGLMTAWFAYPNIEESMNETRQYYIKKFAVNQVSK